MSNFEQTNVADISGTQINPANDETIILLRRMVKLLESQGITDTAQRQRVVVDSIVALPANQSVNTAQIGATTVATGTGVSSAGAQRVTISQDSQIDNTIAQMRMAYNTGIRSNLIFS